MAASPYRPLDKSKQEFRLLELQPDQSEHNPLICRLITKSLLDNSPNSTFESLSYAWGDDGDRVPLQVNGCTLMIRRNLSHALRAIRQGNAVSTLWVDAVSINQTDVSERNHQVQLMRTIYTGASRVNIWLGPDFNGAKIAFATLEDLANGIPLIKSLGLSMASSGPRLIPSLQLIFEHKWWSRLWVIQEALLAREATVHCGPHKIKFGTIMSAFELLWNEYITSGQALRSVCGAKEIESLIRTLEITVRRLHIVRGFVFYHDSKGKRRFRDSPASLPYLLHSCAWSQVTDLRDKIYGTLGLFSNAFLEPDYSIPVKDVYTKSAYSIMKQMGNLRLMSQAITLKQSSLDLPSFVPDWSQPSVLTAPYLVFYGLYNAAKDTEFRIELVENSKLSVVVQEVDTIEEVGPDLDHRGCTQSSELRKMIRPILMAWKQMYQRSNPTAALLPNGAQFRADSPLNSTYSPPTKRRRQFFEMPVQSQESPVYRDADYTNTTAETLRLQLLQQRLAQNRNNTFPMQSAKAPLLSDGDYKLSRSSTSPWMAHAVNYEPQGVSQSMHGPMLRDADYSSKLPPSYTRAAAPATLTEARRDAVKKATALGPHRSYDSFSHTYVDSRSPDASFSSNPETNYSQVTEYLRPPDDFWRTVCMDVIDCPIAKKHRRCLDSDYPRFNEWLTWIVNDGKPSENIPQLHWHLITILQEKCMFKTTSGKFGLASKNIQVGDRVCILAGESYPYVLRPVGTEGVSSSYNRVCPTFLDGIMDGQKVEKSNLRQAFIV